MGNGESGGFEAAYELREKLAAIAQQNRKTE